MVQWLDSVFSVIDIVYGRVFKKQLDQFHSPFFRLYIIFVHSE